MSNKGEEKLLQLNNRILELDLFRGIAVILMILDHFMYDIWGIMPMLFKDFPGNGFSEALYDFSRWYWNWNAREIVRYIILFVFLGLTGVCCSFSKSNLKRGAKLLTVAYLLTVVTYIIGLVIDDPNMMITFGVLHCIAISLILIGLLEKFVKNKWCYLAIGIIMLMIGIIIDQDAYFVSYEGNNIIVLTFKQMLGSVRCGSDCFPLFLNGGQIFIGVFLGKLLYEQRKSIFNAKYSNNPLTFVGRNSLVVYFAHQVILPVITALILLICGFTIAF